MTLSHCGEVVRKHDPDRFLLSLFAPVQAREALWPLYAFNYEIARTRETVTETQLGLIRLQWWRDALAGIYERGGAPHHPILQPLSAAIRKYDLPRELFDNLIYAREFDLEDRLPANLEGMMNYADFTATPLMELALRCSAMPPEGGIQTPPLRRGGEEEDARKIATAYALTGLLRAIPHYLRQRRCYLPEDLMREQGIAMEELYEGKGLEKLKRVVEVVASTVQKKKYHHPNLLPGGEGTLSHLPPLPLGEGRGEGTIHLHLTRKLTDMYLAQIKAADYDVFSSRLSAPPFLKELRLWWATL